jgi:hypothetical protein
VFPGGGVIVDLTIKTTYLFQVADLIEKLENDTVTSVLMPPPIYSGWPEATEVKTFLLFRLTHTQKKKAALQRKVLITPSIIKTGEDSNALLFTELNLFSHTFQSVCRHMFFIRYSSLAKGRELHIDPRRAQGPLEKFLSPPLSLIMDRSGWLVGHAL